MRWCIVMHEDDFIMESIVLPSVLGKKVVSYKLHILCRGHLYTFGAPKGADPLCSHDSGPKHDSTTTLLTLQPCWNRVAVHPPSTTLSIWTIQGCTALISEQDCLIISLHVFFCPMQPFLLVSIGYWWPNRRFMHSCKTLEDSTP
ncbi:unnamed protein product [Staurois parvus]|uniref:Uncharacterized protein n=1 Tax=Staurois parvus TaxID=386267 RepID=A0ABN9B3Y4_9NEOB|nr:unnamed protein product [Staurois parvus]